MGNFSQPPSGSKFNALKHYVGVRLQQGVPIVDADWNEMEDIRKFELQAFLKWFVGDGVPGEHDFEITAMRDASGKINMDNFWIANGRCIADGWDVINDLKVVTNLDNSLDHTTLSGGESPGIGTGMSGANAGVIAGGANITGILGSDFKRPILVEPTYQTQPLYITPDLARQWEVPALQPLTPPTDSKQERTDIVYLDTWEREVSYSENPASGDPDLRDPRIGEDTCVRLKREWVVRVAPDITVTANITVTAEDFIKSLPKTDTKQREHAYYALALIQWGIKRPDGYTIPGPVFKDLRRTHVNVAALLDEIVDARGMKGNLGNRLDESLTRGGQLRQGVVGNEQVKSKADIEEAKILFNEAGHDHSGGIHGHKIDARGIEIGAITADQIANGTITGNKIRSGEILDSHIAIATLHGDKIADGTILTTKMFPGMAEIDYPRYPNDKPIKINDSYPIGSLAWKEKRYYMPMIKGWYPPDCIIKLELVYMYDNTNGIMPVLKAYNLGPDANKDLTSVQVLVYFFDFM